jgi:hypothetical protein
MASAKARRRSGEPRQEARSRQRLARSEAAAPGRRTWTARRVILLALLAVPLAMIVLLLMQPQIQGSWLEIAFYAVGVPIGVANLWEWGALRLLNSPPASGKKR